MSKRNGAGPDGWGQRGLGCSLKAKRGGTKHTRSHAEIENMKAARGQGTGGLGSFWRESLAQRWGRNQTTVEAGMSEKHRQNLCCLFLE